MATKLTPDDARVSHHTAPIRGKTYYYALASPPDGRPARGTIVLIHGFPDLGFGWRNQVPLLAEGLRLRVIVPDLLGYGQTDAPDAVEPYAHKSLCADLVALVDHVGVASSSGDDNKFFVGGHDWGGALAWRMALWHPDRLRGVFSVCTPFLPPSPGPFLPLADLLKLLPNFAYQAQMAGDELWQAVQGEARLRKFLQVMYGGRAVDTKQRLFDVATGLDLAHLDQAGPTPLLSEDEIAFYVQEYARHGLRGPTNWYRTRRVNWEDEQVLVQAAAAKSGGAGGTEAAKKRIDVPALMLMAESDEALPPALSKNMDRYVTTLTKVVVPGSHWVLWQSAAAANAEIEKFLEPLLAGAAVAGKAAL